MAMDDYQLTPHSIATKMDTGMDEKHLARLTYAGLIRETHGTMRWSYAGLSVVLGLKSIGNLR